MSLFELDPECIEGSGYKSRIQAGEELADHRLVFPAADGRWYLADADSAATSPVVALTIDTIKSGKYGMALRKGFIGLDSWAWTLGGLLYSSTTPGLLTQTVPSGAGDQVQVVGLCESNPNIIWFDPAGLGGSVGTWAHGAATVLHGNSYVTVNHGLGFAPNNVQVTPTSNLQGRTFWVSDVGAVSFRINISSTSISVDYGFYWRADQ